MLPNSVAGVFAGIYSDKNDRATFLAVSMILSGFCIAFSGIAQDFGSFAALRIAFGVLSAAGPTTSLSLIRDFFPEN